MQKNTVSFSSPSNIAFVKYWGKYGRQMPMNPSISMTLSECKTLCSMDYFLEKEKGRVESFLFEGEESSLFEDKISRFLKSIEDIYPLAKDLVLNISTSNTFPHSAGIASSASAMSALCMCLAEIERRVNCEESLNLERASFLARLASGSACRSIFPSYAVWGKEEVDGVKSVNEFAIEYNQFHESFKNVCDSVLIVSKDKKDVSSSMGHKLMDNHPFRDMRIEQAKNNFNSIIKSMETGDWNRFGEILETEALTLHALMMSSTPSFILLKPGSLSIIEKIRAFRSEKSVPLYFTIDAGPNMHLIYPESFKSQVLEFIEKELLSHCEEGKVIHDFVGMGFREEK